MTPAAPAPLRAKSAARGFLLRLWLAVALLNLVLIGFVAWSLQQSRLRFEERALVTVDNLSHLMEQDIAASVRVIDLALLAVGDEVQRAPGGTGINALIEDLLRRLPELDGLRVVDAQGDLTHGTGVTPRTRVNVADRDYFIRLRDEPGAGLVVGEPVKGRLSGKWVLNLARGLRAPDGRFLGVVQGSLPLHHIIARLLPLQFGTRGSFTVFDTQFRLVVRHPVPEGGGETVGRPFGSPELRQRVASGVRSGVYKARSIVDQVQRTSSFRRITGTGLYLVIGLAEDDYLAGWHEEVGKAVGVAVLFLLTSLAVAWLIRRSWRSQAVAVQALEQAYRTLEAE
ncbi:MAG: cache domain-containing protein [Curvibacter sp.]